MDYKVIINYGLIVLLIIVKIKCMLISMKLRHVITPIVIILNDGLKFCT